MAIIKKAIEKEAIKKKGFSFAECIAKIITTPPGKEATMYGPLRDLFINVFAYPASDVDIDTTGDAGRPDITVFAPTGLVNVAGVAVKLSWIVVEAKDEHHVFRDVESREEVFAEKSKYIGTNTAWFVMVEPTCWVARPVGADTAEADIVVDLTGALDQDKFANRLVRLASAVAGVSEALIRFRAGDESLIAYEKLYPPAATASKSVIARHKLSKKRFFNSLRDATQYLQDACRRSLSSRMSKIDECLRIRQAFGEKYGGDPDAAEFDSTTLLLRARPSGPVEAKEHDSDALKLRKRFARDPSIARLALGSLREFQLRTGAEDDRLQELFAIESANLVLARVLLLRFFEDHGFFGTKKYLCNGGVRAFQQMREYFEESYLKLLGQAYRRASAVYASAFDETELDWIFTYDDPDLSSAIEWVLFQLAKYDFRSVRGDILTGIYDRFLDRAKRKELGEFYTPPSIARYMVDRVGVNQGDPVLDPACGSGTFLIEAYKRMIGDAVEQGAADWSDVIGAMGNVCGNDINTFSSVIAQIQLLWQVLRFKADIEAHGLPDLQITGRANSLVIPDQFGSLTKWGELDAPRYAAVVGNPPFVRSERSDQKLDERTKAEFESGIKGFPGVSAKLSSYALFLYRALHSWARAGVEGGCPPGRVAFIVQVSLFDSNELIELRKLFSLGGRWTIKEIVDLELIYRDIFDADVLPAIFICENRTPTSEDLVSIRVASRSCVLPHDDGSLPSFDLVGLPESRIPYANVFTPDGRILTRLITESRLRIINKLWSVDQLGSVARRYWIRRRRTPGVVAVDKQPTAPHEWVERRMIAGGVAFRRKMPKKKGGPDVYKGENIVSTELQGEPVTTDCDIEKIDDPSLWRHLHILPTTAFAVARVAHCANAVSFDPQKAAFTNTATVFVPRQDAIDFPFDLLFLSNIYVYFYALAARMGILRLCRSDIYPTNLAWFPWSDALLSVGPDIERMRHDIVQSCTNVVKAQAALKARLVALGLKTLKQRVQADAAARIEFGDGFHSSSYKAEIGPVSGHVDHDVFHVNLSDDLLDWLEVQPVELGPGIVKALETQIGEELSKGGLLNLPIPVNEAELATWDEIVEAHSASRLAREKRDVLDNLDAIVGRALGLDPADIQEIQRDLESDPFLQRIRPRYPGIETRKQGFRTGLDSTDRYD